jgi:hypothetical protein
MQRHELGMARVRKRIDRIVARLRPKPRDTRWGVVGEFVLVEGEQ